MGFKWVVDTFFTKFMRSDKVAHVQSFFDFMIVGYLLMFLYDYAVNGGAGMTFWYKLVFVFIVAEIVGIAYEIYQGLYESGASWKDWIANQVGIGLGVVVLLVFYCGSNLCF